MKKALALVLALVLALSMAVSAFAATAELKDLTDLTPADPAKKPVAIVDAENVKVLYTDGKGTYYIALTDEKWVDVKVTASGNVTAELVKYDPETMEVSGMDILYSVTQEGKVLEGEEYNGLTYEQAKKAAKEANSYWNVTVFGIKLMTNVNIIAVNVEDNYTAHYTEGVLKIEAKKEVEDENGKKVMHNFGGKLTVINDVTIFEYEQLKWTAQNFDEINWVKDDLNLAAALKLTQKGYSDYETTLAGYGPTYDFSGLRNKDNAAVVSTTGFRAIAGEDLAVVAYNGNVAKVNGTTVPAVIGVELYDIAAGQKGVNFKAYSKVSFVDAPDANGVYNYAFDYKAEELKSIDFGFYGDQVIKGEYEITLALDLDWYDLRELFNLKVEEDDIISYYLVDANGKVVGGKEVDYMTADLTEKVAFTVKGENAPLGQYSIVLEVAAAEVGEANPNTGAESVVGVVAALAVVSVATAAAVSLKK